MMRMVLNNQCMKQYTTIDEYIDDQPVERKKVLQQLRQIIKKAAPDADEVISYGMPAFKQQSVLVYFALFKDHYGFYPTSKPIEVFKDKLANYKTSKGAVQFALDKPLPAKLITDMVRFRVKDNLDKMKASGKKISQKISE